MKAINKIFILSLLVAISVYGCSDLADDIKEETRNKLLAAKLMDETAMQVTEEIIAEEQTGAKSKTDGLESTIIGSTVTITFTDVTYDVNGAVTLNGTLVAVCSISATASGYNITITSINGAIAIDSDNDDIDIESVSFSNVSCSITVSTSLDGTTITATGEYEKTGGTINIDDTSVTDDLSGDIDISIDI